MPPRRTPSVPATDAPTAAAGHDFSRIRVHPALPRIGRALDADVSGIRLERLHGGPPGVSGETRDDTVRLAPRRPAVAGRDGDRLLGHEVAHVLQHRLARQGGRPLASEGAAELEAQAAGQRIARGQPARVRLAAAPAVVRRSRLSDTVTNAATKGEVFDALRAADAAERADRDVEFASVARFGFWSDDRWLASQIIRYGPEPNWPESAITERTRLAAVGKWAPEPGNIAGGLADPDPDPAPGPQIKPIPSFFFPGRQASERVLVIGGVHGEEPEGIEVVERLRQQLTTESAAGNPPRFPTILVPTLIERTAKPGTRAPGKHWEPGSRGQRLVPEGVSRTGKLGKGGVEPNRNFPFPGTDYAAARAMGAKGGAELETLPSDPQTGVPKFGAAKGPAKGGQSPERTTTRMLPETRALIALLERFKPTRIVSVHSHGGGGRGNAPGVFVDQRGTDPTSGAVTDAAAGTADLALTRKLFDRASAGTPKGISGAAFAGNVPAKGSTDPTLVYATTAHPEGNSLGMYGPVATRSRPAATTITVELPRMKAGSSDLDALIDAHRDAIDEVILR